MTKRSLVSIVLALLLALTSQAMAVARGSAMPVDQMVLCIGSGSVTVYVDENGAPTGAPHFCPDCALNFADTPVSSGLSVPQRIKAADLVLQLSALGLPETGAFRPHSRAPPFPV